MVDDKIDGNEGLYDPGVLAHPAGNAAHGGKVAEKGNARKVLEQNAADDERDLLGAMGRGLPCRELPDVRLGYFFSFAISKDRFEDDADRDGEAGYAVKACSLKRGKGIEPALFACARIEFTKGVE